MPVPLDTRSPHRQQRWIECRNDSASSLAPMSVVQVIGSIEPEQGRTVLLVSEAISDSPEETAVTGHLAIPSGEYGICTMDFPAYARCTGTPANGEIWGLPHGETSLASGYNNFVILGDYENGIVRVMRACCCHGACPIFTDTFNRTNSTIVSGWTEVSGDWSIASNELHEAGTTGATIIADTYHTVEAFFVWTNVTSVVENAIYRVIVNYLDATHYHYAEFEFLANTLKIRLCNTTSGVLLEKTWSAVPLVGQPELLRVCFSERIFWAAQSYSPYGAWITNPSVYAGGYKSGLGNGTNVPIDYDSYTVEEQWDANPDCTSCACRCEGIPLPMTLHAECSFSGSLAGCDPVTVTLNAIVVGDPDSTLYEEWYGTTTVQCPRCIGQTQSFTLWVIFDCCRGGCDPSSAMFHVRILAEGSGTIYDYDATEASYECDPLDIIFSWEAWTENGWCTQQSPEPATITIEVTE